MTEPKDNQTAVNDTRTLARSDTKLTQPRSPDVLKKQLKTLMFVWDNSDIAYRGALAPILRQTYRRLTAHNAEER